MIHIIKNRIIGEEELLKVKVCFWCFDCC